MPPKHTRETALVIAEAMIAKAPGIGRRDFNVGYFAGLVGGWAQCGLISNEECRELRLRMHMTYPKWWDLAARLGL